MHETETSFSFKSLFSPFSSTKAIHYIIVIGFLVYSNSLQNDFVVDDIGQIVENPLIQSPFSLMHILFNQTNAQLSSDYYRPLPILLFYFLYHSGGPWIFHVIQIVFHISNTIVLFLLSKKYIRPLFAFIISLLFLVHPINEETIVYIANLQDVMFVFFGLTALYLLHTNLEIKVKIVLVHCLLLLSILSKESGSLFIIVSLTFVFLFSRKLMKWYSVGVTFTLAIYSIFRFAAHIPIQKQSIIPLMELSFLDRMQNIPAIFFHNISVLFYPLNLIAFHTWVIKEKTLLHFYLPFFVDILFLLCIIYVSWILSKNKKVGKRIYFFLIWFFVGVSLHLQFIPLDFTVADHYFYFPFIGLLCILGIFLNTYITEKYLHFVKFVSLFILSILSLITFQRNFDWVNQKTLFTHDIQYAENDFLNQLLYGVVLYNSGKYDEAIPYIKKSINLYPHSQKSWNTLGSVYYKKGNITLAKQYFQRAIDLGYYAAAENMALLLWEHEKPVNLLSFTRVYTKKYPNSAKLWSYNVISEYTVGDKEKALYAAKQNYILQNTTENKNIYFRLLHNEPLHITR